MQQVFDHIRAELLRFTEKVLEAGADLISYSDSVGGVNVLGPKNMAHMAETVTLPLLHEIQALADGKCAAVPVPEADFALTACELARFVALPAVEGTSYVQACLNAKRPDLIYGQSCPKHYHFRIRGTLHALELLA